MAGPLLARVFSVLLSVTVILPLLWIGNLLSAVKYYFTSILCLRSEDHVATLMDRLFVAGSGFWVFVSVELEGKLKLAEFQNHFLQRLKERADNIKRLYKLTSLSIEDYELFFWRKDENFKISNNIRQHPETAESEQHLQRILAGYAGTPYQADQPPWYIILIPTWTGSTLLLFMIDHAIADGVGCMALINQLLVDAPGIIPQPKSATLNSLSHRVTRFWNYASSLKENISPAKAMGQKTFASKCTRKMAMLKWTEPMTMCDVQAIRKSIPKTTLNDVICGTIIYSVIEYMRLEGIEKKETEFELSIPGSIRDPDVGKMTLFHPILENLSHGDHIRLFSKLSARQKVFDPYIYFHVLSEMIGVASMWSQKVRSLLYFVFDTSALIITNVAGPSDSVEMMKKGVKDIIVLPPCRNSEGFIFSISSYNGQVRVGISDKLGIITDLQAELLLQLIYSNFRKMVKSC